MKYIDISCVLYLCNVRYDFVVFCLYLFLLSVWPCSDSACHFEAHHDFISVQETHNHDHSDNSGESQDNCSPFCSCMCCGTVVLLPVSTRHFISNDSTLVVKEFYYSFTYSMEHQSMLFQPPIIA